MRSLFNSVEYCLQFHFKKKTMLYFQEELMIRNVRFLTELNRIRTENIIGFIVYVN